MQLASRPACITCVAGPPARVHAYPDVHGGQVDMIISTTCIIRVAQELENQKECKRQAAFVQVFFFNNLCIPKGAFMHSEMNW